MSNIPIPPIIPGGKDPGADPTKDVDGTEVLDDDVNDDLVNSADADALASHDPDDQD